MSDVVDCGHDGRMALHRIAGFDPEEPEPDVDAYASQIRSPGALLENGSSAKGKERATEAIEDVSIDDSDPTCSICLADIWNQAEASPCGHDLFCFACLHTWCAMSRRCPLCNTNVELIKTHVRSETDYQAHHLLPLASTSATIRRRSDPPIYPAAADIDMAARRQLFNRPTHPRHRRPDLHKYGHRVELDELEEEELALQRRKWIYKHKLFAKHVASNAYTRYQSFTPAQFANSPDRKSRVVKFARRELQAFANVDVEWLVTYLLQIMCQLDLRSDNAIRLLAEFLGWDQAEHFAHEVLTFARSPYSELKKFDQITQYDRPQCRDPSPPPNSQQHPETSRMSMRRRSAVSPLTHGRDVKRRRSSPDMPVRRHSYVPHSRRDRPKHRSPSWRTHSRDSRVSPTLPPLLRSGDMKRDLPEAAVPEADGSRREDIGVLSGPAAQVSSGLPPDSPQMHQSSRQDDRKPLDSSPTSGSDQQHFIVIADDDDEVISLGDFATPPPASEPTLNGRSIALRGFADASARRAVLQARLEAEKAEVAMRSASDPQSTSERRKIQLAEMLKREKAVQLKHKLLTRLEEEKRRADVEANEAGKSRRASVGHDMGDSDSIGLDGIGYDREAELRRALEARMAVGKTRIDPKVRLKAEMSAVEARLQAIRHQMGL